MSFGINVNASSSTSYEPQMYPYMFWETSDINYVRNYDFTTLWHRYINIPLRVANYCQDFPGHSGTNCPAHYNASIGMIGLNNASNFNEAKYHKYYTGTTDFVNTVFRNNNGATYGYFTNQGGNKIKKGYFNNRNGENDYDQTHKQNIYYLEDTHSSYPFRVNINSQIRLNEHPNITTNNTQPAFSEGNVIMYKMSYMLGPVNGNFGDGTWSFTNHGYIPEECPNCYPEKMVSAYETYRQNVVKWFWPNQSYVNAYYDNYESNFDGWKTQNLKFAEYFDQNSGIPGNTDPEQYGTSRAFQASNPMYSFLNNYGHTYRDNVAQKTYYNTSGYRLVNNNGTYQNQFVHEWHETSAQVFGEIILRNNDNNVKRLNTSAIVVAQPYFWRYTDNGNIYYSQEVWFLDIYLFGYIDGTYTFNQIYFRYNFDNQLSTYGNVNQLDLYMPDEYVLVIGSGTFQQQVQADLQEGITNAINDIPIIGPIIAIILEILIFCFGFILSFINLLSTLPIWVRGGILVLFVSLVTRIIYKIIRGG